MAEIKDKLYKMCKQLELYSGYTEGVMDLVEDSEEDQQDLLKYYETHPTVNEFGFLGYAMYLNIK